MASEIAAKAPKSTRESLQVQSRLASGTVFEGPTEKSTSTETDLAPKTPQEGSRRPVGTPQGTNFDLQWLLFGPPGRRFLTPPCEPLSHASHNR